MSYKVFVRGHRIWVNGFATTNINPDGYRLVAETRDGLIVKADFYRSAVPSKSLAFQTHHELDLYQRIAKEDQKHFPKLVAHGSYTENDENFVWIIQQKLPLEYDLFGKQISPAGKEIRVTKRIKNTVERLELDYELDDLGMPPVGQPIEEGNNWAIIGRTPVIYDFGYSQWTGVV